MINFIYITTEFEGLHCWPNATPPDEYLKYPHRHLFKVHLEMSVFHSDREIEINSFKRWLDNVIKNMRINTSSDKQQVNDFGSLSCEQIAENIIKNIIEKFASKRYIKCTILEDGLLGAGAIWKGSN